MPRDSFLYKERIELTDEDIEENYKNVVMGRPLTIPLRILQKNEKFAQLYIHRKLKVNKCPCGEKIQIKSNHCRKCYGSAKKEKRST